MVRFYREWKIEWSEFEQLKVKWCTIGERRRCDHKNHDGGKLESICSIFFPMYLSLVEKSMSFVFKQRITSNFVEFGKIGKGNGEKRGNNKFDLFSRRGKVNSRF